jgi:hypothetical protein
MDSRRSFDQRRQSRNIILTNIDPYQLDIDYKLKVESNIGNGPDDPNETTKIDDIIDSEDSKGVINFFDQSRVARSWVFTMKDYTTMENVSHSKQCNCFYDHHPIGNTTITLGCPIKYIPHILMEENKIEFGASCTHSYELTPKQYKSHIKKGTPVINPGSESKKSRYIVKGDYYLTDGFFCSFNCMFNFIKDNKHNVLYKESITLMKKLYFRMSGTIGKIHPAHHWRLLQAYGGFMSIKEFREKLGAIVYQDTNNILLQCSPIGIIFSEERIF